jgi:large subunit ribosomal protein L24
MIEMKDKPSGSKKIRKGDNVLVIAGNNKGKTGIVQFCKGEKIVVQGLNMAKKHIKKTRDVPQGRIVEIERPIHISNLKLCVEENLAVKLKVRRQGDQEVIYRSVKKPKE